MVPVEPSPREERILEISGDHIWPLAIVLALAVVMVVNAMFIFIAVSGADEVVPSYQTETR